MVCPVCGLELVEGICGCFDSDPALADEAGDEGGIFLPLVESGDVVSFSQVTSRLEELGIAWFVQGEESVAVIYAAAERLDEARAVVQGLGLVGAGVGS
jgi:hypothetical protein